MRALSNLANYPTGALMVSDEVRELHAARLLLLIHLAGEKSAISGLTKMAKLDFFTRYPTFFDVARGKRGAAPQPTESSMIRFHYGPWDRRYYHLLAYLSGLGLLRAEQRARTVHLSLTPRGKRLATDLAHEAAFEDLVRHLGRVRDQFGKRSGTDLKKLIYQVFRDEVVLRPRGAVIR